MWSTPNTIDYSSLEGSLKPKSKSVTLKNDVAKEIWNIFLQSNNLDVDTNLNNGKIARRNRTLNQFANNVENASEWVKTRFVLAVDYLISHNLINAKQISSLKLSQLSREESADKRLNKIIDEFRKNLSNSDRLSLDKSVAEWLINLSNESERSDKLGERVRELEQENSDLQADVDAMSAWFERLEKDALSRWSFRNMQRVANSIHKINENKKWLPQEEVTRRVLWQADKFVFWWSTKSRRIFKSFKRMDVNKQYNKVVDKLNKKLPSAKPNELLAIRRIQIEINKAHDNYINEIRKDTKRNNIRNVNFGVANAA